MKINRRLRIAGALQEGFKYFQLYNAQKIWAASADLADNINIFDRVTKIVDDTYAQNPDLNSGLGGRFNKGDIVNFVIDGTLPLYKAGIVATDDELQRNLTIMFIGIQIINNHKGENYIKNAPKMPWNYHSTHVTQYVKDMYKAVVEEYGRRNDLDMCEWLEVVNK